MTALPPHIRAKKALTYVLQPFTYRKINQSLWFQAKDLQACA